MDNEKKLFEKGCFLPNWQEDVEAKEQKPILRVYGSEHKDLTTLLNELDEIKQRIFDIREKEWQLARMLNFHNNDFVKE